MNTTDMWPAGATWVFQGTVAEDATAGTHVCTLTVTPGAGNEIQVLYGRITQGASATSHTIAAVIDDGTNGLVTLCNVASVSSGAQFNFPTNADASAGMRANGVQTGLIVSGTMRLVLSTTTTAVSVTQTFAVVCRIKTSALPTATLADTVGAPTLTTNTNTVF